MTVKARDEQILSLKHELKILDNKLKTKLSEMSQQKQTLSASHEEGKKVQESHQSELEMRTLELQRMKRQLADKDEELSTLKTKATAKLDKVKQRNEQTIAKLNDLVKSQLADIESLRQKAVE